jgi:hypothetical protein
MVGIFKKTQALEMKINSGRCVITHITQRRKPGEWREFNHPLTCSFKKSGHRRKMIV